MDSLTIGHSTRARAPRATPKKASFATFRIRPVAMINSANPTRSNGQLSPNQSMADHRRPAFAVCDRRPYARRLVWETTVPMNGRGAVGNGVMVTRTPGQLGVVAAAVCCCLLAAACGAERGEVSAAGSSAPTIPAADSTPLSGSDAEAATGGTEASGLSSTTNAPTEPLPTADPGLTLTTVQEAEDESPPSEAEPATTTAPQVSENPPPSVTTSVAPIPTETTAPTLEVVGGEQSAAGRVPEGQTFVPFATFAEVTLVHPSVRVERIGFHESNHDGARQLEPTPDAIAPIVLDSRQRGTGSRTAADIVVEPGTEIRAPVTGTVLRAGGYILYCDHHDDFLVIEPDSRPGWEVKLLHINGVMVSAGDRVEAGVTVVAPEATVLPFDSQVDEFTRTPPWPHVHIEVVDPSIPDRPSTGGGC